MSRSPVRRRGFTLVELLIGLVIAGIIGAALVKLMVMQGRFYGNQQAHREARGVSRAALNSIISELRMLEEENGVVAGSASATGLTVRVPYALGVLCSTSLLNSTVALMPVDSAAYASTSGGHSGYLWRDEATGLYTRVEPGLGLSTVAPQNNKATCPAAGIDTLPVSKQVIITPAIPLFTRVGSAVMLYQQIRYEFKMSNQVPGTTGLWRRVVRTGAEEELAAPFDASAQFQYYVGNSETAQAAPADVKTIFGVQMQFNGMAERAPLGSSAKPVAKMTTAVFFKNRRSF